MTKRVRIENADTAPYKVIVQIWDKGKDGAPDVLAREIRLDYQREIRLDYQTAMTSIDVFLTSTRYIVVKEE